jgi:lactate permease
MVSVWDFFLAWTPMILILILAVFLKRSALSLALWGTLFTSLLVWGAFETPLSVIFLSALDGVLTTLPLLLVIYAGILLSTLLLETGSLARLVKWLSAGLSEGYRRIVLIGVGICNFMEGASVIAEPVVAPMLRAVGVSPQGSAALSIVGYSGLMTLEMAGIIITVLSLVTGLPESALGWESAILSLVPTLVLVLSIPWVLGDPGALKKHFFLLLWSGLTVGLATLGAVRFLGISISGMIGGLVLSLFLILGKKKDGQKAKVPWVDLLPFLLMLVFLFSVNVIPILKELTFERWVITVSVVPVHQIHLRPLYSAYPYLFAAYLLAWKVLKVERPQMRELFLKAQGKAWRAVVAMGLFGAMGQIIAFSGYRQGFTTLLESNNLAWVLAQGLVHYTGGTYPLFAPFLGWTGTFLTGYGVASIMLFGKLQVTTAHLLSLSPAILASGMTVGAAIGSVSSPFKIAIATPMCGAQGQEGEILRKTIPLGLLASFFCGLFLWVYALIAS